MKRSITCVVALMVLASSAMGQVGRIDSLLIAGSDAILRAEYDSASLLFQRLASEEMDDPSGPVMLAAVLLQRAEDAMFTPDRAAIDSLITIAEFRARALSPEDPTHRTKLTFVASGRGILSRLSAMNGDVYRAVRDGLSAASLAEDIIEADSSAADAGLVLGNYYYWKSRKVEILSWLPFVSDSRWEGLRLLEKCAVAGKYQRHAAMNSLAWALMDADRFSEAEEWLRKGLQSYPSNRSFLRNLAYAQERTHARDEALETWGAILRTFGPDAESTPGGMFEGYTHRASLLIALGRLADGREELERARSYKARIGRPGDIPRGEATEELFRAAERVLRSDRSKSERPHATQDE